MLKVSTIQDLDKITPKITELYFDERVNKPLFELPFHLKKINFDIKSKFNYSLDFLPEELEELILNSYKNHTLEEIRKF